MNTVTVARARRLFSAGGSPNTVSFIVGGFDAAARARLRLTAELAARRLPAGVGAHVRDASDAAFHAWIGDLVRATRPPSAPSLENAQAWVELAGHTDDRAEHGALEAVWQAVRLLVRDAGAEVAVWDGLALEWRSAVQVLALPPGDLRLAVAWRCETIDGFNDQKGASFVCIHTLGLAKFGRPDLVACGSERNRDVLRQLVSHLAQDLVDGAVLRPGDVIEKGGLRAEVLTYEPGENAPQLDVPFYAAPLVVVPDDQ
ncbi:MAG: hypothetical protein INH41_25855 [Myxococcaceae bacterium]|jgi:hypothetical protein|nr:hypothetical protein [Myxococcaceae bacterium]MCA3015827.1 hypothetical protein [Myxococcaceae bacterium]